MKKRRCALLLTICMLTGIIGCGKPQSGEPAGASGMQPGEPAGTSEPQSGTPNTTGSGNGGAGQAGAVQYDEEEMEMLRNGVNGFSYHLFERLEGEENIFFSPYSLCSALSLLNLGAGSETEEELEALLGITDIEAWNDAMRA